MYGLCSASPQTSVVRAEFLVLLPKLGGPCPYIPGPSESSFAMAQQTGKKQDHRIDFERHVALFPTRYADYVPTELPTQSATPPGFGILPTADGGKVIWAWC